MATQHHSLQQAILKMSSMLERKDSLGDGAEWEADKVDQYIQVLQQKYSKIRNILAQENHSLEEEHARNETLKEKLVKEQEDKEENIKSITAQVAKIRTQRKQRVQQAYSEDIDRKCRQQQRETLSRQIQDKESSLQQLQSSHQHSIQTVESLSQHISQLSLELAEKQQKLQYQEQITHHTSQSYQDSTHQAHKMQKDSQTLKQQLATIHSKIQILFTPINVPDNQMDSYELKKKLAMNHKKYKDSQQQAALVKNEIEQKNAQLLVIREKNKQIQQLLSKQEQSMKGWNHRVMKEHSLVQAEHQVLLELQDKLISRDEPQEQQPRQYRTEAVNKQVIELEQQVYQKEEFIRQQDKQVQSLKQQKETLFLKLASPVSPAKNRRAISMLEEVTQQANQQVQSTQNRLKKEHHFMAPLPGRLKTLLDMAL